MTARSELSVKPPPSHIQPLLIDTLPDKALETNGESRARYGVIVQDIVCELLDLTPIPNTGTHDVVFDAFGSERYIEIKSVREKNKSPIYEWRRRKERQCGAPMLYAFAFHRCRGAETLDEAWRVMAETLDSIYLLSLDTVDALALAQPLRQLVKEVPGSRMGFERAGYCEGYRNIPWREIVGQLYERPRTVTGTLHGLPLEARVFVDPVLGGWLPCDGSAGR